MGFQVLLQRQLINRQFQQHCTKQMQLILFIQVSIPGKLNNQFFKLTLNQTETMDNDDFKHKDKKLIR